MVQPLQKRRTSPAVSCLPKIFKYSGLSANAETIIGQKVLYPSERRGKMKRKDREKKKANEKKVRTKGDYIKYIGTAVIFILTFYLLFSYKGLNLFLWA